MRVPYSAELGVICAPRIKRHHTALLPAGLARVWMLVDILVTAAAALQREDCLIPST